MSEELLQNDSQEEQSGPSELELLKQQADILGVKYSPNIGLETLRERVANKLVPEEEPKVAGEETLQQKRARVKAELMKLVRVRITNMNPLEQQMKGEIVTVANSFLPAVSVYVPYGEASERGYHIPQIVLNTLQERHFTANVPDSKSPTLVRRERRKTFAIEILPPLTKEELDRLAQDQRAGNRIDGY